MALENSESENGNDYYKRADSIVEPLNAIRNWARKKYVRYKNTLIGASIYFGAIRARAEGGERYRTSQIASPVWEMRTLAESLNFTYHLLESKVPINAVQDNIKRKIREEKKRLEDILGKQREEIDEKDRRIYDLLMDLTDGQRRLNGFYEKLGKRVEEEFSSTGSGFFRDYKKFLDTYKEIGQEGQERRKELEQKLEKKAGDAEIIQLVEMAEHEIGQKRTKLVRVQLNRQERMITKLLEEIKKGERRN